MLTKVLGTTQVLTSATGAAATSAALSPDVKKVRIATTTAVYVAFGENPTATSADLIIGADQAEHFSIPVDTPADKVSVLAVTTAGKVSITPVA